jgi:hypothetical protein
MLPLDVSVLWQSVLPWASLSYSSLSCLWTCLFYTTASPALDVSVLHQDVLPRHVCPTAASAAFGIACPTAAVLPLDVSVLQQPVIPLGVPVL